MLVITASALSGLRWSLTQLLLQYNPATKNPFSTLFHLTPIMFVSLILAHILFESPAALIAHPIFSFKYIPLLLIPGVLAFAMTSTEFELIRQTSVVTLSVSGMFKEVLTVLAGTVVFGDKLAVANVWGVLVTLGGIAWYNWIKVQKMRAESLAGVEDDGKVEEGDDERYEMVERFDGSGEEGAGDVEI